MRNQYVHLYSSFTFLLNLPWGVLVIQNNIRALFFVSILNTRYLTTSLCQLFKECFSHFKKNTHTKFHKRFCKTCWLESRKKQSYTLHFPHYNSKDIPDLIPFVATFFKERFLFLEGNTLIKFHESSK